VPVLVLQGGVEAIVPEIDLDVDEDLEELHADHGGEQQPAHPAILGLEIGQGEPPDDPDGRDEAFHVEFSCRYERIMWVGLVRVTQGHRTSGFSTGMPNGTEGRPNGGCSRAPTGLASIPPSDKNDRSPFV